MKKILVIIVALLLMTSIAGAGPFVSGGGGSSGDATTVNGAAVPASKTVVGTNSSSQVIDASSATLANNTTGNATTATNLVNTPIYSLGTVSGTDTYTATGAPTLAAYASGQRFYGLVTNANTSTTPTLNVTSKGAITIVRLGDSALVVGDIPAGHIADFFYNGTNFVLLNPGQPPASVTGQMTVSNGVSPGCIAFQEGSGGGTNKVTLCAPASTGDATVTLSSTTGTEVTTADKLSALAATSSAELRGVLSDETGTGAAVFVDGALGTPSFTALNMPTSNADPGTTAGQIKHDSTDTGSNSGGTAKWYDGAQARSLVDTGTNYTIITKTEYLPIKYAEDGTTAPTAVAQIGATMVWGRSFTEADDVVYTWIVPNDYVGGIKYRVFYALSANAQANETVIFSMGGCIVAHSAALACAAGTALTNTQELTTNEDTSEAMITSYSAESNADWNLAAGALARLAFSNAAAGDYTGEPLVIGVEIKYKAKIAAFGDY